MANASTMPASLTIKICSKEISSDKSPEDGTILVPSSELKCFTNDDMGLVLRSMPWFTARHTSLRTLPLSEVRCMAYKRWCHSAGDGCTAHDIGTSKTVLTMGSAANCEHYTKHPDVYADLKCCSTHGCNLDSAPAAAAAPGVPPKACQVVGVQVQTAMPYINANSTCDSKGTCYNMTALEMKHYIGTPRMVPLEPHHRHFSCIDGRHDDEIIATPAGDMGIFLSSAFVYIDSTPTPTDFSLARVKALLSDFIRTFRTKTTRFYYHTDEESVHKTVKLLKDLGMDAKRAEDYKRVCDSDFVPPEGERAHALQVLTSKDAIGCGHVKYMMLDPAGYGITSADLVKNTLRALWELKWGDLREYIKVEPLGHNHTEQAVLSITNITGCDGFAPLITQRTAAADNMPGWADEYLSGQIFANHDHSVKVVRNKVADYFVAKGSTQLSRTEFRDKVDKLADTVQLMASASKLAMHRPLYTATIKGTLYTPDYWNGTVPSGSLYCYVGTDAGLVLRDAYAVEEADLPIGPYEPRCVRFVHRCREINAYCGDGEAGAVKTVVDFATEEQCETLAAHRDIYGLQCCSTHGCNYKPVTGPSPEVLGAPPAMACQLLGVRVDMAAPHINADSTCEDEGTTCYDMTALEMKEYIGSPAMVPLEPNHFSCIDGRHDDEIVATPAGDMGIFLSSAFIYVNRTSTPRNFSVPRLKELLKDFILTFRSKTTRFYYHTDEHTLKHLVEELKNRSMGAAEAERYMHVCNDDFAPRNATDREMILRLLSDPKHGMGCGHVKYMAQYPADYGITNGTFVTNTVRALWELKWGELRDYIHVDPLGHEHTEQAVLSINSVQGCDGFTPLITQRTAVADGPPNNDELYAGQIFANHDHSVKMVRDKVAAYYTRMGGMTVQLTADAFRAAIDALADGKQLGASAGRLAKHRPMFNATIVGKTYIPDYRRRLRRRLLL